MGELYDSDARWATAATVCAFMVEIWLAEGDLARNQRKMQEESGDLTRANLQKLLTFDSWSLPPTF